MRRDFWYKSQQIWWYPRKVLPPAKLCWHSLQGCTQPPGTACQYSVLMLQAEVASICLNYIMFQLPCLGLGKIISAEVNR